MERIAVSYEAAFCPDPMCGLHLNIQLEDGSVVSVVMSVAHTNELIDICKQQLNRKVAELHHDRRS